MALTTRPAALFLLGLLVCLCGCSAKQAAPLPAPGRFTAGDGTPISASDLAALTRAADYILIGERHDNATDHAAQAAFLKNAAVHGIRPALGLEMLPRSRFIPVLEQYAQGSILLKDLPAALDWKNSWGFDFSLYSPVFAVARDHSLPVYGLNIPHGIRASFSRKGLKGLSDKEKNQLPQSIIPPLPEQREKLSAFYRRHSAMLDRARKRNEASAAHPRSNTSRANVSKSAGDAQAGLERFLLIQSLWDSTMAEEALRLRARTGRNVAILAGVGHVERGWGIAHRLSILAPGARILLVMPFSGARPDPELGDIFFYSP